MNTNTLKIAELQEAVDFYASVDFDPNQARPLMELVQGQTEYIQKRFWKLADEAKSNSLQGTSHPHGIVMDTVTEAGHHIVVVDCYFTGKPQMIVLESMYATGYCACGTEI